MRLIDKEIYKGTPEEMRALLEVEGKRRDLRQQALRGEIPMKRYETFKELSEVFREQEVKTLADLLQIFVVTGVQVDSRFSEIGV